MALSGSTLLRPQSALQQLLEEINFQRTKEMRQLLKDDGGFVVLQGTTYWTDLFVRHFLFQAEAEQNIDSDDLLFFVRKKHVKGSSRHMPKYETEVDVYRKDSRKLPIGDPDVDWEETVYLNLIIHQFNYTLTLAICTRTSPKELQVLRRHSQKVYASPSRRKMDTKGDGEDMTYPHICFMVDNFDEVFGDIMVRDGEMVCVELVANDRDGTVQGVIFLGSIRYDALKKVYDARQSSISSKLAQRMTFGLFSGAGPQTRCEFVRMKGPQGKGHAEMAVTKPKGSGVETPTSEPGFCATDMWDDEWDENPDDFLNYRHQRRLSDPSANLNNFNRYGWKTKVGGYGEQSSKARSENEGLDSLANEMSEIEAGDLKDDRPAFPATDFDLATRTLNAPLRQSSSPLSAANNVSTPNKTRTDSTTAITECCNCFGPLRNQWSDSSSQQMSEVYCRVCDNDDSTDIDNRKNSIDNIDSPACLIHVTTKKKTLNGSSAPKYRSILTVESELELLNSKKSTAAFNLTYSERSTTTKSNVNSPIKTCINSKNNNRNDEYELADDATICNGDGLVDRDDRVNIIKHIDDDAVIRVQGKEELPVTPEEQITSQELRNNLVNACNADNSASNRKFNCPIDKLSDGHDINRVVMESNNDGLITTEETAKKCAEAKNESNANIKTRRSSSISGKHIPKKVNCTNNHPLLTDEKQHEGKKNAFSNLDDVINGNDMTKKPMLHRNHRLYSTLPKMKKPAATAMHNSRPLKKIPSRVTPDGTTIYYWCDLSKQAIKELDDGAYNPLWATKGFTQTFHFWKEHRRQQSTPLNAFLTYVTLPWWSIAKDLLDHRETPILTF